MAEKDQLRKKKCTKCLLYIFLFAVFHTVIMLVFVFTIMKIRTPKFRLTSAAIDTFSYSVAPANPSFNIRMNAEFSVKNTNFGRYKFHSTGVFFYYNGVLVGSVFIPNSGAGARSTKRFGAVVDLSSAGLPNQPELAGDLSSGILMLNGRSRLNGEVEVLVLKKKKKSAEMNCVIAINLREGIVGYLSCN